GVQQTNLLTETLDKPEDVEQALRRAGFEAVQVRVEDLGFHYADEEEYWAKLCAQGARFDVDKIAPDKLPEFKADLFRKLQACRGPQELTRRFDVIFRLGKK